MTGIVFGVLALRLSAATRRIGLIAVVLALFCAPAGAADYLTYDDPAPDSADAVPTPIDGLASPAPPEVPTTPAFEPDVESPFLRDTQLNLHLRSYYLERNREQGQDSLAWALGGWLAYQSGLWMDRIGIGATAYTTQPLYAPKNKPGTGLLEQGQEGFTVLGEAFVDVHFTEQLQARLYRQTFDLPYLNRRDIRMVPNTFEGYLLFDDKGERFNYVLGHVTRIKNYSSDRFVSMAEEAGAEGSNDGVSVIGALYKFSPSASLGAINEYGRNTFNTFYAEATGPWNLTQQVEMRLSGQYTNQSSLGEELAGRFSTTHLGIKADLSYAGAVMTLAHTRTGDDHGIRNPWGGSPSYASLIVKDFDRASEKAWRLGLSYDFAGIGWNGMSGFVNYANGDTRDSGPNASPDQQELDFTIDFKPPAGVLQGLWLRARAAFVDEQGADAQDLADYRLILNYEFPLL
jgi:hypothetical protein